MASHASPLAFPLGGDVAAPVSTPTTPGPVAAGNPFRDFMLDGTTGDLAFAAGDFGVIDGTDSIASDLKSRLGTFKGEWFLDTDLGIPYFQSVLVKQATMSVVRDLFRQEILACPGVTGITSLDLSYRAADRTAILDFTATTDLGAITLTVKVGT